MPADAAAHRTSRRPPPERILEAAGELFYAEGIGATGVERLCAAAGVSKRTLYTHFDGKDAVVAAYLRELEQPGRAPAAEQALDVDRPPRERLLAVFDALVASLTAADVPRGCPFANAAIELADAAHPARAVAAGHKRAFTARLEAVAREAGASEPAGLAQQLAVLFDGAAVQAVALQDAAPAHAARDAARALIAAATA